MAAVGASAPAPCICGMAVSPDVPERGCFYCSGWAANEFDLIEAQTLKETASLPCSGSRSSVVPAVRDTGHIQTPAPVAAATSAPGVSSSVPPAGRATGGHDRGGVVGHAGKLVEERVGSRPEMPTTPVCAGAVHSSPVQPNPSRGVPAVIGTAGANPAHGLTHAEEAQRNERRFPKPQAAGSSPALGTRTTNAPRAGLSSVAATLADGGTDRIGSRLGTEGRLGVTGEASDPGSVPPNGTPEWGAGFNPAPAPQAASVAQRQRHPAQNGRDGGSNPSAGTSAPVAQRTEQPSSNRQAGGSIPPGGFQDADLLGGDCTGAGNPGSRPGASMAGRKDPLDARLDRRSGGGLLMADMDLRLFCACFFTGWCVILALAAWTEPLWNRGYLDGPRVPIKVQRWWWSKRGRVAGTRR